MTRFFRKRILNSIVLILIWFAGMFPCFDHSAYCQDVDQDFDTVSFGIQNSYSIDWLHENWDTESGIHGFIRLPLFTGNIQAGMQYIPFERKQIEKPDFKSMTFYGQYDREFDLPFELSWSLGGRLSIFIMRFSGGAADVSGGMKEEQEFGLGAVSGLRYPLPGGWQTHIEISFTRIYTARPIDMTVAGVGVSRTIDTPGWLREFLW